MQRGFGVYRRSAWCLFVCVLAGCAPVAMNRTPESHELENVRSGQASVVLMQVNAMVDGRAVSPIGMDYFGPSVRLWLANLGERGAPNPIVAQQAPSEAAATQGWHYMLLPPGTYYMLALPPGVLPNPSPLAFHAPSAKFARLTGFAYTRTDRGAYSNDLASTVIAGERPDDFRELPGFWFQVPAHEPIVYVGTLALACTAGRGVLGDLIDSCSDFAITVDSRAAREVADSAFAKLGKRAHRADGVVWEASRRDCVLRRVRPALPTGAGPCEREGRRRCRPGGADGRTGARDLHGVCRDRRPGPAGGPCHERGFARATARRGTGVCCAAHRRAPGRRTWFDAPIGDRLPPSARVVHASSSPSRARRPRRARARPRRIGCRCPCRSCSCASRCGWGPACNPARRAGSRRRHRYRARRVRKPPRLRGGLSGPESADDAHAALRAPRARPTPAASLGGVVRHERPALFRDAIASGRMPSPRNWSGTSKGSIAFRMDLP